MYPTANTTEATPFATTTTALAVADALDVSSLARMLGDTTKAVLVRTARALSWKGDETKHNRAFFADWLLGYGRACGDCEPVFDALADATKSADPTVALRSALEAIMGAPKVDLDALRDEMRDMIAAAVANVAPTKVYVTERGEYATPTGQLTHAIFDDVLSCAALRLNVLLVGPAGCGKTALGRQVADALSLPFGAISCTAGMSESQLGGWLLPMGEAGRFVYVPALFVTLYENGGVFLIDEIDAGDENVLVFLNQALANGGFFIPQRTDRPYAKRHADFVCIAAANTYGHGADRVYAGRNKLDGATLDRFRSAMFTMDYDPALEAAVAPDTGLRAWASKVRQTIASHRLARVMSTRFLIDASKRLAAGHTMAAIKASYLSDWTKDEQAKLDAKA
jgi:MoxR-like ATPase